MRPRRHGTSHRKTALALAVALVAALALAGAGTGASAASAKPKAPKLVKGSGTVRGFDGTTIKVGSIGIKGTVPEMEWGVRGRINRFNDTKEIPGIKLEYTEFADDKNDPATALSETRRLVTEDQIFAIVGDFSPFNPGDYLIQQKVPYVGAGLDATYCSTKPSTKIWGFSPNGCQTNPKPSKQADTGRLPYEYTTKKLGTQKPTAAIFSSDVDSGKAAARFAGVALTGAGFDVVYAGGLLPGSGPITDYTPYVQKLLTMNDGKAPDTIVCLLTIECLQTWDKLKAGGYQGVFEHFLYSDLLAKPMEGTILQAYEVPFGENTPQQVQMAKDIDGAKSGQGVDTASYVGYSAADMFITALKPLAKKGKAYITPDNLQKVLSTMTWEVKGLGGPISYPASTVTPTPECSALLESDGTTFKTVIPYSCSSKTFPVK